MEVFGLLGGRRIGYLGPEEVAGVVLSDRNGGFRSDAQYFDFLVGEELSQGVFVELA